MQHVWQYNLETHLRKTSSSSSPSVRTPPCRDGGSNGGWKNTIWSLLQGAPGLHIIYILFWKAVFWNPSAHSSQWYHQRHVWDKSMQEEQAANHRLLFMIRDSAFVINHKYKVLDRMKSCILHKYLTKKVNPWREIVSTHRADVHPLRRPLIIYSVLSFWEYRVKNQMMPGFSPLLYAYIMCVACMWQESTHV